MLNRLVKIAAIAIVSIAGISASSSGAHAATTGVHIGNFSGNDECPQPGGGKTSVAALAGHFCIAKFGEGNQSNGEQGDNVALAGSDLLDNFTLTGAGSSSGTFAFDDQGEGFSITHLILKAGSEFAVFALGGATSGTWMTGPNLTNNKGNPRNISHISFFGQTAVVPLPAGILLLLTGLGGLGVVAARRRNQEA